MNTTCDKPRLSQQRLILILGSLAAIGPLSVDMYLPAFPAIAASLQTPLASVEASLASFFAGLSCGQLLYGPLSDRFGRKSLMLGGLTLYTLSSFACAMAQNVDYLIALRFLQALGACGGMVISRAIIRDCFNHQEAAKVYSMLMLIMGVAPILAPLLGGYVATSIGWRYIFWLLVGFGVLSTISVATLLPETHGQDPTVRLSKSASTYLALLKQREFMRYTLTGSFAQAGMFAYITGSPFVFISYFGIPSQHFGWIFGFNAFGLIAASQINARYLRRNVSYQRIIQNCLWFLALAALLLILAGALDLGMVLIAIPLFFYIALLGATFPNTTAAALAKQTQHAGSASALLGTIQMMLAAIASTVVSSLHAESALVMTTTVGICGLISLGVYYGLSDKSETA